MHLKLQIPHIYKYIENILENAKRELMLNTVVYLLCFREKSIFNFGANLSQPFKIHLHLSGYVICLQHLIFCDLWHAAK